VLLVTPDPSLQGRRGAPAAWEVGEYVSGQRVEEVYRVRLPLNRWVGGWCVCVPWVGGGGKRVGAERAA
jgi:hypothetical protein